MLFLKSINLLKYMFNTNEFSHSFWLFRSRPNAQHWLHLSLALIPSVEISNDMYKFLRSKSVSYLASESSTLLFLILLMRKEGSKGGRERKYSLSENTLAVYKMSHWEMHLKRYEETAVPYLTIIQYIPCFLVSPMLPINDLASWLSKRGNQLSSSKGRLHNMNNNCM